MGCNKSLEYKEDRIFKGYYNQIGEINTATTVIHMVIIPENGSKNQVQNITKVQGKAGDIPVLPCSNGQGG